VAHYRADLVFCHFQLFRGWYLDKYNYRSARSVGFLIRGVRNIDYVVARETKDRSQRLEHADDGVGPAGDTYLLTDSAVRRSSLKQVLQQVWSNDADLMSGAGLRVGPYPSHIDAHSVDRKHRRGIDAA